MDVEKEDFDAGSKDGGRMAGSAALWAPVLPEQLWGGGKRAKHSSAVLQPPPVATHGLVGLRHVQEGGAATAAD